MEKPCSQYGYRVLFLPFLFFYNVFMIFDKKSKYCQLPPLPSFSAMTEGFRHFHAKNNSFNGYVNNDGKNVKSHCILFPNWHKTRQQWGR